MIVFYFYKRIKILWKLLFWIKNIKYIQCLSVRMQNHAKFCTWSRNIIVHCALKFMPLNWGANLDVSCRRNPRNAIAVFFYSLEIGTLRWFTTEPLQVLYVGRFKHMTHNRDSLSIMIFFLELRYYIGYRS